MIEKEPGLLRFSIFHRVERVQLTKGEADVRFEVSEEEAHCRHPAAGTRLQRKTHHVELRPSVYHKVMCITVTVKALTKVHAV